MFSTTFRSEYHNYSEFLQKESRERGLEHSARHATRAKPHLFVDPTWTFPFGRSDPNVPFLSTRPKPLLFFNPTQTSSVCQPDPKKPLLFVNPTQTSPVCQPDPNLFCLSTPPKPPLFCRSDPNLSCLSTRPKPPLFVDPNQPSFDPLSYYGYYWIIDICLPRQSLKFARRIRLIRVILVITERDGVSYLVKTIWNGKALWSKIFILLKSIFIYIFILDAAGSCYIRVSQKCFRAVIRRWHVTTHLLYMCVMRQYVGSVT